MADGLTRVTVAPQRSRGGRTIDGVAGHEPGRPFRFAADRTAVIVEWVTKKVPRDFGLLRGRRRCEAVALLMACTHLVEVTHPTMDSDNVRRRVRTLRVRGKDGRWKD